MRSAAGILAWMLLGCACAPQGAQSGSVADGSIEQAILVAEATRIASESDLERLIDGLEHESPEVQRRAVRAVGRLEQPGLHILVQPLLRASTPEVRAEAASALAQTAIGIARPRRGGPVVDVSVFSDALLARLAIETDPEVLAVISESLGHLPYRMSAQVSAVEAALVEAAPSADQPNRSAIMLGVAKGLESLLRLQGALVRPADPTRSLLRSWVTLPLEGEGEPGSDRLSGFLADRNARIRRLALSALGAAGDAHPGTLEAALADSDPQVRRLAVAGIAASEMGAAGDELLATALDDQEPMVRIAVVRALGQRLPSPRACRALASAPRDDSPHVALQAIERLGACDASRATLVEIVESLPAVEPEARLRWHRPASALLALARLSPAAASERLPSFADHGVWLVRMYAARAAGILGDRATLERLAADVHANVREAAVRGLVNVAGHEADAIYRAALEAPDYHLIRTAALALDGTPDRPRAAAALFEALQRLTAERRDTSRDPRGAIFDRLATVASAEQVDRVRPYLRDFDPQIAGRAASLLRSWTGVDVQPDPQPLELPELPDPEALDALASATARVTMARGGTFVIRLLADEAPLTVASFVRLARAGYYDGLTFHRVVPNFVIQGGSPGANEFMGDGRYMRDEVGMRPHLRGAVGISTRGRDTGDAQFFIDLIDNPRLDHNYTVFGLVVDGLEVVDSVLEGDVIARVEIR